MNVGDLVRFRHSTGGNAVYNDQAFLVVGKSSYSRLQILKPSGKTIEIHPDWLEVVNEHKKNN